MNGPPDEPAPTGIWALKGLERFVRLDVFPVAYWIAFLGAAIVMIAVLSLAWHAISRSLFAT